MALSSPRLQAVNTIIANIGQAPVNSLESGNPLVELAEQVLEEISKAVQSDGWHCNTELHLEYTPDNNGEIQLQENILSIDSSPSSTVQVVTRGGKLYDKYNHTFTFTAPVELDVIWLLDFEDLPAALKNYVTIRAANVFAGRAVGSSEASKFGEREEILARAAALEYDTQQGDYSIFSDSTGNNSYQGYLPVYSVLRR